MKWRMFFSVTLLILAFVLSMGVIMPSGSHYCFAHYCGIYFWGAHEHDSVWHLAVINTLFSHAPFQMPNMSGSLISGYNYLMDLIVALLVMVSHIDASIWFFKILPVIWFGLMSYLSYLFARSYRKSNTYPIFVWLFVFFGSSLSYILKMRNSASLWGSSSVLSMQALQNMLNPQFAWSLIPLLLLLIGLNQDKRIYKNYFFYGLYAMVAFGLKFYTGTILLSILASDLLIQLIGRKKQFTRFILQGFIVLTMSLISVWIFYSPGKSDGFPFAFRPWATVNPIIEDKTLLYLPTWAERLYAYRGAKLGILELVVLGIFVICNFGSRIFGLWSNIGRDEKTNTSTKILLIIGMTISFLASILLTQRGVWWNTVQFLYISLFLGGLLAAEGLDKLWQVKKTWAYALVAGTIILLIPNNIDIAHSFLHIPGTGYIDTAELRALSALKAMPAGTILTPLFNPRPQTNTYIEEISRKYDTGYVSAYTAKQTYLSDVIQLQLTNIAYQERLEMVKRFDCRILDEVSYIYEYTDSPYTNSFSGCNKSINRIIATDAVNVYQVK